MSSIAEELAQTELLRDVPDDVLRLVIEQAAPQVLAPGEVLLSPERENHHVYLLLSGVLTVHFDTPDSPAIREISQGLSVGEMSIINSSFPSAFVIAKVASRVFPIHCDIIHHLIADKNPVARNLLCTMSLWLKNNTQRIVKDRLRIWELTDQANVDALTGLYNRRWLDNALPRLVAKAGQGGLPLCIMVIDVDHFKHYNDTQGHPGGDRALMALGDALKTSVRPYDFATRYGGEEFLVMLPNTPLNEGVLVAERIRKNVSAKTIVSATGDPLPGITVSIGLAMSSTTASPQDLLSAADAELYSAKRAGRNCVKY